MTPSLPAAPRWLRYAGVVACAAVILYASTVDPGEGAASTLFGVETTVYLHFLAYAGLAGAVGYALLVADRRALLMATAVAVGYGAGLELLQSALAYRTASALDVLVNAAGAVVGAGAWLGVASWFGAEGRTADRGDR